MFKRDDSARKITMHQGDTGSYRITLVRSSGAAWGENDRMLYTISGTPGIVMQRVYRLDRDGLNGHADIEFHNDDTQEWPAGTYSIEVRALVHAYWNIPDPPTEDVVDMLVRTDGAMVDGDVVRTNEPEEAWSLDILNVFGEV